MARCLGRQSPFCWREQYCAGGQIEADWQLTTNINRGHKGAMRRCPDLSMVCGETEKGVAGTPPPSRIGLTPTPNQTSVGGPIGRGVFS